MFEITMPKLVAGLLTITIVVLLASHFGLI